MAAFVYDAPYPIREDIVRAHRDFWQHIAAPGSWWSGAERVAMADACRSAKSCDFCKRRKEALTPYAIDGEHEHARVLAEPVADAIHRVTTDASRLSQRWFEELVAAGVSDGQIVELIGLVTGVVSIDAFHQALGLAPEPLPEPQPGEPTRQRPQGLVDGVAWVPVLDPAKTAPAEADLFPGGKTGNIIRALSLVPDELRRMKELHAAHYISDAAVAIPGEREGRTLNRLQLELLAARVSALNECFY